MNEKSDDEEEDDKKWAAGCFLLGFSPTGEMWVKLNL